jgi:flagellar biosynthesis/type III secretory pathway chaperone
MEPRRHTDGSESLVCSWDTGLEALTAVLEELIEVHQQLLPVLQAEKRLMVEGEVDDVLPCLKEKELLLHRVRETELRHRDVVESLAVLSGQPTQGWTLSRIISLAPPVSATRLRSCQACLESLTASMIELNQLNGLVAERIVTRVNGLIGLLRHLSSAAATYQPNGALRETPLSGRSLGME